MHIGSRLDKKSVEYFSRVGFIRVFYLHPVFISAARAGAKIPGSYAKRTSCAKKLGHMPKS